MNRKLAEVACLIIVVGEFLGYMWNSIENPSVSPAAPTKMCPRLLVA